MKESFVQQCLDILKREDIKKRSVILDKPYADITRVWIAKPKEADNVL